MVGSKKYHLETHSSGETEKMWIGSGYTVTLKVDLIGVRKEKYQDFGLQDLDGKTMVKLDLGTNIRRFI